MENSKDIVETFDPDTTLSSNVQSIIQLILPSDDALDQPDFNTVNYINSLFPTEQSLSNIDDVINKLENNVQHLDKDIRSIVRGQTKVVHDGKLALKEAHIVIKQLFFHIKNIKEKAEKSEDIVKEITQDIKQLDFAKKNLTSSITALNHLHMLVSGIETLKVLTQKKQYGEIILPLQATTQVMQHFKSYMDIPQINELTNQVQQIHVELAQQITVDFKKAFSQGQLPKQLNQLSEGCLVLSVLDSKIRKDLLTWFVDINLKEYTHLFGENQEYAWLDKIDRRYAWFKKHLLEFESKLGSIFPSEWEVSQQIAVQFCNITREDLIKLMQKRHTDIDVKILLYAIQKTISFENLLAKRFANALSITDDNILIEMDDKIEETANKDALNLIFMNLIGKCFESYLYIYFNSLDQNLSELIENFLTDSKINNTTSTQDSDLIEGPTVVLSSCADLFIFYKKCIIQCSQLNYSTTMIRLAEIFQKYLHEYAIKILQNNLPKITSSASIASSVSSITREFRDLSTSGLIQNFQIFLKEGENSRYSKDELSRICCILITAEYCLETTQQLEEKLRKKATKVYVDKINLSQEQDAFHGVISNCIQLLVKDLELGCEPSLIAMTKIQWNSIEVVGDQSSYVSTVIACFRQTIPILRDRLSTCRKYFTQLCVKFASSFIPKLIQQIYKCKPINTLGAEQLLLDVHILKSSLLELPSCGSQVQKKAPITYTKVVTKGMTTAEMILKITMTPTDSSSNFVQQCKNLLPDLRFSDFQKILEMKGMRKSEQVQFLEEFKQLMNEHSSDISHNVSLNSSEHESGGIKKLEKLIKKRG